LAINFNKFTLKAQEAMQAASEIALSYSNQQIDCPHLLAALLQDADSLASSLIKKIAGSTDFLRVKITGLIEKLPKVSGTTSGNLYLSNNLQKVLDMAVKEAGRLKDEFISIEHILLALADDNNETGQLLNEQGITKDNILNALKDIRGSQRVTSQDPEETYQSLKKYGRDLNQAAKQGKLDPVIGREEEIRRVLQVLSRRTKNNPVLVGEPGVGKTAIAEGLAFRIVNN